MDSVGSAEMHEKVQPFQRCSFTFAEHCQSKEEKKMKKKNKKKKKKKIWIHPMSTLAMGWTDLASEKGT